MIPVYQPSIGKREKEYVIDCLDSTWISSKGKYINMFEDAFAGYTGIQHAASVSNGTVAIHVALDALGIGEGDEVIVPTFTYIASVNAIAYTGATPVFVDSLPNTWQIDPADVQKKITGKTKAIMVVHLYGHPCDMTPLVKIAKDNNLYLVEDCAEAIGARYEGKHVGGFGDIATFSFFGNKTITTGEGGMVMTNNKSLHDKVVHLKGQGLAKDRQYWHDVIGYNYRMTNICAAIGLAQFEQIDQFVNRKLQIADKYRRAFKNSNIEYHEQDENTLHSYWMCSILIKDSSKRDAFRNFLAEKGIETRPLFYPVHTMPIYSHLAKADYPVANDISARGINLPSYPGLQDEEIDYICKTVFQFFQ
jgi:perosamine synthetase